MCESGVLRAEEEDRCATEGGSPSSGLTPPVKGVSKKGCDAALTISLHVLSLHGSLFSFLHYP